MYVIKKELLASVARFSIYAKEGEWPQGFEEAYKEVEKLISENKIAPVDGMGMMEFKDVNDVVSFLTDTFRAAKNEYWKLTDCNAMAISVAYELEELDNKTKDIISQSRKP